MTRALTLARWFALVAVFLAAVGFLAVEIAMSQT